MHIYTIFINEVKKTSHLGKKDKVEPIFHTIKRINFKRIKDLI